MAEEEEESYNPFLDEIRDIAGRPLYYNRASEPITLRQWCNYRTLKDIVVAKTQTPAGEVSTVWLGIDHRFLGEGPPLIFETMVFGSDRIDTGLLQWRYSTEEEALHGHLEVVEMCGGPLVD